MSFIPYLRQPPTHTQIDDFQLSDNPSQMAILDDNDKMIPATSNSVGDPFGLRQWSSNLVKLSGKNRALNEFSVERLDERSDQNLVMLHGASKSGIQTCLY